MPSGVELSAGGADANHDGLIEIKNAVMLNNMRYDLAQAQATKPRQVMQIIQMVALLLLMAVEVAMATN